MTKISGRRELTAIERKTKDIYTEQHKNYAKDHQLFDRFLAVAVDPATYDVAPDWIKGKTVLDAGCGNTGYVQVAMHRLGAKKITCLDLGNDWIPELQKLLDSYSVPRDMVEYVSGSTDDLPFPDESFDFVICNGVIMHLASIDLAEKALAELARVTGRNGKFFVYSGIDKPGIVDRYILPALRTAYAEDEQFRDFIDHIDPVDVVQQLQKIYASGAEKDNKISAEILPILANLFTLDTATFTQNVLQVPVQQAPKLSEAWAKDQLAKLGMKNIRRVKERYWMRNDFRRFLAPFHYRVDLPIPKMLYGNGHVKIISEK